MEQRSWLHLFACFSRYLALVAAGTFLLCDLAVSVDNGVAWYCLGLGLGLTLRLRLRHS